MKDLTGNNAAEPAGGPHAADQPTDRIRSAELDVESTQRIRTAEHGDDERTELIDVSGLDPGGRPAGDVPPPVEPSGSERAGGPRGRSPRLVAAVIAGAVLVVLAVVYLVDVLSTSGEIERNTSIAGVDVGGMTPAEATAALTAQAIPAYNRPVTVDVHGEPTPIDPEAAGLTADVAATVEEVGVRSASPIARVSSLFMSTDVPLAVTTDAAALSTFLEGIADKTDVAPVEGQVAIEGTTVRTVEPVTGRTLEVEPAVDAVASAWAAGGPSAVNGLVLPVTDAPVRASSAKVDAAAAEASKILSAPVRLVAEGARVQVPVAGIAAATTVAPDDADGFTVAVDVAKVRAPHTAPVEATQAAPKDAVIAIQNGAPVITPSTAGRTVDWKATEAAIGTALRGDDRDATVVYATSQPSFTTEKAKALGIKEVIGEFTTGGFASASGENIRVVAEKVNGAVVAPGATFGLNEFTGPRGVEQGYVEAAVIQEGALAKAVGGGISQFATTLYNAAYFAGMGDVTHTPHSFYISRYPPGREATVYDGEIELAFSNDYPTGVLIQTIFTDSDITVRLWGTKQVEVESVTGERFDITPPQVVVKPAGSECIASGGSNGFSIVDTRIIRDLTGKEIRREDFTTVYNGQQNVVCSAAAAPTDTASGAPAAGTGTGG